MVNEHIIRFKGPNLRIQATQRIKASVPRNAGLTPLLVDASLRIGDLILVEAALSYLGLGIQPPVPSWGNMIADGATALRTAWWVAVPAATAITMTVLGFHLLGDGLRDRLDPR